MNLATPEQVYADTGDNLEQTKVEQSQEMVISDISFKLW